MLPHISRVPLLRSLFVVPWRMFWTGMFRVGESSDDGEHATWCLVGSLLLAVFQKFFLECRYLSGAIMMIPQAKRSLSRIVTLSLRPGGADDPEPCH